VPDGRGARIALEAGFLLAVAVLLGAMRVDPVWIVLVMTLAWVIVALLEWAAWREEPHWASGQPPRYYVPAQAVPPRPPTQELPAFSIYPQPAVPRDDAPTWIATPEMRDELLGWPAGVPVEEELEPVAEAVADEVSEELLVEAAVAASEPEEQGWDVGWPAVDEPEPAVDPWVAEELPEVVIERFQPAPEPEPEPVFAEPEPDPDPEPEREAEIEEERAPVLQAIAPSPDLAPRAHRLAGHRLDPFSEERGGRWPWQRGGESPADAELPSLPHHARIVGGDSNGAAS
jgi:hypothetical protein